MLTSTVKNTVFQSFAPTRRSVLALGAGLAFSGVMSEPSIEQNISADETRAIAKDAYIFAYPVALQYHTLYIQAVDAKAKEYVGGFSKYRHYGMSSPDNKDIVTPNNDTPYSWAQLDLRAEPWVLTLPKTDGRIRTTSRRLYNLPARLLVPNTLRRYSIGSQTPGLKSSPDGSVTIYIQKDSPGPDKESNWLPAPDAPFFAVQRVYGPGEAERTARWKAPPMVRSNRGRTTHREL